MPQRFFTMGDVRAHGLTAADVRGASRRSLEAWRLSTIAVTLLREPLTRAGFDPAEPIHVHESPDPPGFVLTQ